MVAPLLHKRKSHVFLPVESLLLSYSLSLLQVILLKAQQCYLERLLEPLWSAALNIEFLDTSSVLYGALD